MRAYGGLIEAALPKRHLLRRPVKDILNGILAEASGKTLAEVTEDTERDHFMSAEEAKTWGIVDKVL